MDINIKIVPSQPAICNLIECHKKRYYGIRNEEGVGGRDRAIVAFYLLITNNETKYRVQLPDRCDSRTILKESFECTSVFFCQFNYFTLINTTATTITNGSNGIIYSQLRRNVFFFFFFFFFVFRIFVFFQVLLPKGVYIFLQKHSSRPWKSFAGVNYESRNFRALILRSKFYIPRGETKTWVSRVVQPLNILPPRFKAVFFFFFDDFAHDSKEQVYGGGYAGMCVCVYIQFKRKCSTANSRFHSTRIYHGDSFNEKQRAVFYSSVNITPSPPLDAVAFSQRIRVSPNARRYFSYSSKLFSIYCVLKIVSRICILDLHAPFARFNYIG